MKTEPISEKDLAKWDKETNKKGKSKPVKKIAEGDLDKVKQEPGEEKLITKRKSKKKK